MKQSKKFGQNIAPHSKWESIDAGPPVEVKIKLVYANFKGAFLITLDGALADTKEHSHPKPITAAVSPL